MPIPIKIAGILNPGHGPPALAHVSIGGLWSYGPNFTVSSIAKYLRDCEDYNEDMRGDLDFKKELEHPLLKAFMNENIFTKTVVGAIVRHEDQASISEERPFNKLPPMFYIQLDNSGKDNKNWVLRAFFSVLIIRGVFKTVVMSFLIVGHTHEDVDVFFSKRKVGLPMPGPRCMMVSGQEQIMVPDTNDQRIIYRNSVRTEEDLLVQEAEEELAERNQIFDGTRTVCSCCGH
ncbi:hypothetical protein R1sor_010190 [Riccia sorocarpa]|uniref:DUF7869 domain-containing protein n=1 Tax=Riccia sorocarpa TaxID=122646 RepID=A0ABD3HZ92_9MARC